MSKRLKILASVSVAVVLFALLTGTALAQGPTRWGLQVGLGQSGSSPSIWGPGGMMGGGMMGGWGYGTRATKGGTDPVPYGYGPGGCPMYGGLRAGYSDTGTPLTLDQAIEAAEQYLAAYGNPDLALTEVMEFTNNFYAEVEEESTRVHAFELLINRYTGAVYPEPGPNMMWNTKYGHMAGMMGGSWWGPPTADMSVTEDQARTYAQQFLDNYLPGSTVADEADTFYGYYTIHVLRDGQVIGMLSVNGYSGQVWYHTWHGDFIGMRELEG